MIVLDIGEERGLESGIGEFIDAEGAEERIRPHARDEVGAPGDEAALRAAEKFIATVRNDVDASAQTGENARFVVDTKGVQVEQSAGAKVFHQGNVAAAGEGNELGERGLLGESGNFKVRTMDAQ